MITLKKKKSNFPPKNDSKSGFYCCTEYVLVNVITTKENCEIRCENAVFCALKDVRICYFPRGAAN